MPMFTGERLDNKRKPFYTKPYTWSPLFAPELFYAYFDFSPETVTVATGISQVLSKIGSHTFTQSISAQRPAYNAETQSAVFTGTSSHNLVASTIPYVECYAVFSIASEAPGVASSLSYDNAAFVAGPGNTQFFTPQSGSMIGTAWNGSAYAYTSTAYSLNQFDIWRYRVLNGVSQAITKNDQGWVVTNGNVEPQSVVSIGKRFNWGTARYITGTLQELIFTKAELSAENSQRLLGYLAHKRGLTQRLSPTNPYKTVAP